MFLHIDTETSGLTVDGARSDDPRQPRMASIAAILDDENGHQRGVYYSLVQQPPGFIMPPVVVGIHGITTEIANKYGRPLLEVLEQIKTMADMAEELVAFNFHFDFKILKISCAHLGDRPQGPLMRADFEAMRPSCSMIAAAKRIKGPTASKVALKAALKELLGEDLPGAHNALVDVAAQRRLFWHLRKNGGADTTPAPEKAVGAVTEAAL